MNIYFFVSIFSLFFVFAFFRKKIFLFSFLKKVYIYIFQPRLTKGQNEFLRIRRMKKKKLFLQRRRCPYLDALIMGSKKIQAREKELLIQVRQKVDKINEEWKENRKVQTEVKKIAESVYSLLSKELAADQK